MERLNGRAGLEHEYWRHKIADYLAGLGYQIKMEEPANGETDIVATLPAIADAKGTDAIELAIEIETGKAGMQSILDNINKNLKAGYKRIIVVATNRDVFSNIKTQLQESGLADNGNISVVFDEDFVI